MAQQGRLRREDLIWREGMQRWAPAHKVRGLFPDAGEKGAGDAVVGPPRVVVEPPGINGAAVPAVDEEETAIDALPLANQEESKLQLPELGTPDNGAGVSADSNEFVVFEPASSPPHTAESPPARRTAEPDAEPRAAKTSDTKKLRVDVPAGGSQHVSRSVALFLQTFLWVSCLLVIVGGGVIYVATLVISRDAASRLAASGVYATCVVAAYFLASGTQRLCHVLGQWFVAEVDVKQRRNVRERNWKRFQ
jgi:hypothetical protein